MDWFWELEKYIVRFLVNVVIKLNNNFKRSNIVF